MPYTEKQRKKFNAEARKGKPGMKKLAKEANEMKKAGKERKPVRKGKK